MYAYSFHHHHRYNTVLFLISSFFLFQNHRHKKKRKKNRPLHLHSFIIMSSSPSTSTHTTTKVFASSSSPKVVKTVLFGVLASTVLASFGVFASENAHILVQQVRVVIQQRAFFSFLSKSVPRSNSTKPMMMRESHRTSSSSAR